MNNFKNSGQKMFAFLIGFLILNIVQANYTSLFEDEAYYWVWSKQLAWGYFDHPPMVALWAKISQLVFNDELGIRLLSTIGFSLLLWIIWIMIDLKNKWNHVNLFFILVISMLLFQVFGFIITPDSPLLLFAALFLWSYKRFLIKNSLFNTLLLGLTMATLLYSKYHGILLILFVLLSNKGLILNKRFWLASITGAVLFLPHLYWQYENGFPSFIYHLKERNRQDYDITNSLTHLLNMLAIVGLAFPIVYNAFIKYKTKDKFELSLKYIVYGFFIFFLLASFRSQTQAQWLIIITIPLIILTFKALVDDEKSRKRLMLLGGIQCVILLIARLLLAIPELSPIMLEPHFSRQWVPELKENTQGKPVVFVNSYRKASVYNFYTGIDTHSYAILKGRMSQYNLLNFEDNIQGKNVYSASMLIKDQPLLSVTGSSMLYGKPINDYTTFEKVKCIIDDKELTLKEGKNTIQFRLINPYGKMINFDHVRFIGVFQGKKNRILEKVPLDITNLSHVDAFDQLTLKASFNTDAMHSVDQLTFRIALEFYELREGFQGNKVDVKFD